MVLTVGNAASESVHAHAAVGLAEAKPGMAEALPTFETGAEIEPLAIEADVAEVPREPLAVEAVVAVEMSRTSLGAAGGGGPQPTTYKFSILIAFGP